MSDLTIVCTSCKRAHPEHDFITRSGKKSPSCLSCRIAYVKRLELESGERRCMTCHVEKPLADFNRKNGGQPHSNCFPCRKAWVELKDKELAEAVMAQ